MLDGVVDRLLGQAVLQLKRDDRQPVDEGTQIQRPLVFPAEVQLPRDAESVLPMALHRLRVLGRGLAVEKIETQRPVLDAVAQHIDHPASSDLPL